MYCHGCEEAFNAEDRRPKLLPCGHAFCLQCVQGLEPKKCPVDNLEFETAAEELPDHPTGMRLVTRPSEPVRFWCLVERCLHERAISSLNEARASDVEPLLEALRQALQQGEAIAPRWKKRANEVSLDKLCDNYDDYDDDEGCDEPPGPAWLFQESHFASWHEQCLDIQDAAKSFQETSTLLTNGRLAQARALVGLPCRSAPTWSLKVLQQVAPHLEGLELFSPQRRHLDVATTMPRLESLEVSCTFDAPLPVVAYPAMALKWLRCDFYPLDAALALVRANAETLEELHLVAASNKPASYQAVGPHVCPDLAAELRRCGLKKLRKLVLLRQSGYDFSWHDKELCKAQKNKLLLVLVESGLAPSLLCYECDMLFL